MCNFLKYYHRFIADYRLWTISSLLFLNSPVFAIFEDVGTTHPNYHAIDALQTAGVVEGYTSEDGVVFRASKNINRAEALKILMLSADLEILENDPKKFPDVPFTAWFSRYVNSAAEKGIVKGFPNGNFYPEAQVTRAEFLKMVLKSFDFPEVKNQGNEEWFAPFINTGKRFRLISGSDTAPHEALNRGEIAEIIFRSQWVAERKFEKKYIYVGSGEASYYNEGFAGKKTANGESYDPFALTAAHRTLPFDTRLKVWTTKGDTVFVRINDRGPYHEDRILDLSERAFKELAPTSQGVVDIFFEVYVDPVDDQQSIPANIRSSLSDKAKVSLIPTSIQENLSPIDEVIIDEEIIRNLTTHPEAYKQKKKRNTEVAIKPLFKEGTKSFLPNFYDRVKLRRSIPQKVVEGTVIRLAGTVEKLGYTRATFFLENTKTQEQTLFKGVVSGKNFVIPVQFLEAGVYTLGLVFDRETKSKIAKVEVVPMPKPLRRFPASGLKFLGKEFKTSVKPETETVLLEWESALDRVTKITFSQSNKYREVYMEDGLFSVELPYEFFEDFETGENLAIDFYQAKTRDGTLHQQKTNWEKGPYDNFDLTFGFPDGKDKYVGIPHYPRFVHNLKPVAVRGDIKDKDVGFPDHAYVIRADGEVNQFPIIRRGDKFQVQMTPTDWGTYVFEIVSNQGEILFNRGMYFSPNQVLPIFPWKQTAIRTNTKGAVLEWINVIRKRQNKSPIVLDPDLNKFAQHYADLMADKNFISHISPTGQSFASRVKTWGLDGEVGENLSYGSNFPIALAGLENSASHRKNILEKKWRKVGIGIAQNKKGDYYVSQVFGR